LHLRLFVNQELLLITPREEEDPAVFLSHFDHKNPDFSSGAPGVSDIAQNDQLNSICNILEK